MARVVLIVDDEQLILSLKSAMLEETRLRSAIGRSGAGALDQLVVNPISVSY